MLVFGLGLSLLGVGLFCSFLFTASTYALPVAIGVIAGFSALHAGVPVIGAAAFGVLAGLATLSLGWFGVAVTASRIVKSAISLVFAVPAALGGYHLGAGLGAVGLPHGVWLDMLGWVGAFCSAVTAWVRMVTSPRPGLQARANG